MIVVPSEFTPVEKHKYPADNEGFEPWFAASRPPLVDGREYLGIMWTAYYKNHNYGNDKPAIERLQGYLNSLPKGKKYYSVCQYDRGPVNDLSGLDIKLFCMSGGPEGFIPIPLICSPHPYQFPGVEKDILCSFVGRMTDPIRTELVKWGNGRKDCYITSVPHPMEAYCKIMARSKFVLAVRGFGPSSFRVCEAMQYGAMPVIFRHHEDRVFSCPRSVVVDYDRFSYSDLDDMLSLISEGRIPFSGLQSAYDEYYTFEGVRKLIVNHIFPWMPYEDVEKSAR
jgi:hypothetical protein